MSPSCDTKDKIIIAICILTMLIITGTSIMLSLEVNMQILFWLATTFFALLPLSVSYLIQYSTKIATSTKLSNHPKIPSQHSLFQLNPYPQIRYQRVLPINKL